MTLRLSIPIFKKWGFFLERIRMRKIFGWLRNLRLTKGGKIDKIKLDDLVLLFELNYRV